MRVPVVVFVLVGLFGAGCGRAAGPANTMPVPLAPGAVSADSFAEGPAAEVPFHSELTWEKVPGSDTSLCTRALPAGKVYLMRNTNRGVAISTHLGKGAYENHTCVYGPPGGPPQGWLADIQWTAANGDILLATSDFQRWTGVPGKSTAIDTVKFQNGGTGRFEFAEGDGMCYVDALARTAVYDGVLRYGKKQK